MSQDKYGNQYTENRRLYGNAMLNLTEGRNEHTRNGAPLEIERICSTILRGLPHETGSQTEYLQGSPVQHTEASHQCSARIQSITRG